MYLISANLKTFGIAGLAELEAEFMVGLQPSCLSECMVRLPNFIYPMLGVPCGSTLKQGLAETFLVGANGQRK